MRKEFKMTQEQLDALLDACKHAPHIKIGEYWTNSPQKNANRAWRNLGEELGFDYMTVQPNGKDQKHFTAEET